MLRQILGLYLRTGKDHVGINHSFRRTKDYKGGYRLVSKIKDEGFEADLTHKTQM
jgi:hypothetical protein